MRINTLSLKRKSADFSRNNIKPDCRPPRAVFFCPLELPSGLPCIRFYSSPVNLYSLFAKSPISPRKSNILPITAPVPPFQA